MKELILFIFFCIIFNQGISQDLDIQLGDTKHKYISLIADNIGNNTTFEVTDIVVDTPTNRLILGIYSDELGEFLDDPFVLGLIDLEADTLIAILVESMFSALRIETTLDYVIMQNTPSRLECWSLKTGKHKMSYSFMNIHSFDINKDLNQLIIEYDDIEKGITKDIFEIDKKD